jgi:RND family efflux transporter MFP subunit
MTDEQRPSTGHHAVAVTAPPAESAEDLTRRRQAMRRTRIAVIVALVLLALGAGRTVISRVQNSRALEAGTAERAQQYVKTTQPLAGGKGQTLMLPGTLQGFVQSPISARAGGYLKRWHKDIGSKVNKGDLLAEIETPEIDQQLSQAIAARQQAASSLDLARSTVERWESLRKRDAVSQQELDERRSAFAQAGANLAAADANVERLRQLEGFKRIVAPFSGVITRRNVDIGDLIDAGGATGRALFLLAQTDTLRVYVNVPQSYAQLIKPGQQVVVTQSELRGQSFKGEIARTAASIDAATRSMQVEVSLPNREGALLPGAYVQVALPLSPSDSLAVPNNALLFRGEGTRVAVVDTSGKVRLQAVRLGRNYGENVEVLEGVKPSDQLVLNPSDSLAEGDQVTVAPPAAVASSATKAAP